MPARTVLARDSYVRSCLLDRAKSYTPVTLIDAAVSPCRKSARDCHAERENRRGM